MALSTVIVGLLVLTTRNKALTQVVGYLVLENGIYVFGLSQAERVPFLVEVGVLLDIFVGRVHHGHRGLPHQSRVRLPRLRPPDELKD